MYPLLALAPGEIHLWLTFYDEIADEQLLVYRELLTAEEKQRELKFYFDRDRRRYLVTRAMVRTVLSRYAPIDSKAWIFSNNIYGRPEIANVEVKDEYFSFNLSHTDSLIAMGVARRRALGIDVENFMVREISIDIAERFFSPAEVAALAAVPKHQQGYRLFEYWTFKEAYTKARGIGLSLPLDKYSFHYSLDGAVEMMIHPELLDDPLHWQFWQYRPSPQHLVAVCAERISTQPSSLAIRRIVPAAGEEMLSLASSRSSK